MIAIIAVQKTNEGGGRVCYTTLVLVPIGELLRSAPYKYQEMWSAATGASGQEVARDTIWIDHMLRQEVVGWLVDVDSDALACNEVGRDAHVSIQMLIGSTDTGAMSSGNHWQRVEK